MDAGNKFDSVFHAHIALQAGRPLGDVLYCARSMIL
jgi:hypothetical protein